MSKADGRGSDEGSGALERPAARPGERTPPETALPAVPPRRPTRDLRLPTGARPTSGVPAQGGPPTEVRPALTPAPTAAAPRRATAELRAAVTPAPPRRPTGEVGAAAAAPRRPTVDGTPVPVPRRATAEVRASSARQASMEEETTAPVQMRPAPLVGRSPTREQPLPRRPSSLGVPAQRDPLPPPVADPLEEEPTAPLSTLPSKRDAAHADDAPHDEPTRVGALPTASSPASEQERAVPTAVGAAIDLDELEGTPTPTAPLPGSRPRGLSAEPTRRKENASPAAEAAPDELSRVIRLEAARNGQVGGRRFGFQVAIGLVMLVLGVGAFATFFIGHVEKPPLETLQLSYPYGFAGGRLPNGRSAPSVVDITFELKETIDCGGDICLRYDAHSADDSFHLTMDLKRVGSDWKLVGGGPPGSR